MGLLVGPAGRTSETDQLDGPAGRTSSFYLKPWPVRIFEDFPFSLYIVAASESDEGLVLLFLPDRFLEELGLLKIDGSFPARSGPHPPTPLSRKILKNETHAIKRILNDMSHLTFARRLF